MENLKMKVAIIGGMAAGCKTAARLKRNKPDAEVTIIEKQSFVSFGACGMPFFAAGDVESFDELRSTPYGLLRDEEFFKQVKDVDILTNTEALEIDHKAKEIKCKNLKSGEEFIHNYDQLVLATGASAKKAPFSVPETDKISNFHNPLDAKLAKQKMQTGKIGSAVIIGAGYIGCELAEALVSLWGIETTIIEKEDRLLPGAFDEEMSLLLAKAFEENDINIRVASLVEAITESDDELSIKLKSGEEIKADHAFLCLGVDANNELAKTLGCRIGKTGGIEVNQFLQTSMEDIWAAGDCIEIRNLVSAKQEIMPLGSLANRQGRLLGELLSGRQAFFNGAAGAISMKVFGLTTAACGISSCKAKKLGIDYGVVTASWSDRPHYHPDAKTLFGRLIYNKEGLTVLGIQLVGTGELTRYIDAFSIYASRWGTCFDLIEHEHAYTPTHSSPMNPLNDLGALAVNQEFDKIKCVPVRGSKKHKGLVLDVREEDEAKEYPFMRSAKNIPMMEIREAIKDMDKKEKILVYCQKGPRSYEVARMMKNAGFEDVAYVGGGVQLAERILDLEEI